VKGEGKRAGFRRRWARSKRLLRHLKVKVKRPSKKISQLKKIFMGGVSRKSLTMKLPESLPHPPTHTDV